MVFLNRMKKQLKLSCRNFVSIQKKVPEHGMALALLIED